MKHRGDAVGDGLAVAVDQRDVDREVDAGARHHLPLEGIAMHIDDAGQHQQVARIDRQPRTAARCIDLRNVRAGHGKRSFDELGADQGPAALDEDVCQRPRFVCWQGTVRSCPCFIFAEENLQSRACGNRAALSRNLS